MQEQSIDEENGDGPDDQPSDEEQSPLFSLLQEEIRELLRDSIGQLSDRERQILALYYYEELTMKEIGIVLGVGEARVSQMHSAPVRKVRTNMKLTKSAESDRGSPSAIKPSGARRSWNKFSTTQN